MIRNILLYLFAGALLLPGRARAEVVELDEAPDRSEPSDPLAAAQAAYSEIEFEETLRNAQQALSHGGYGPQQMMRIFELIGLAAAALEQDELAANAYMRLLALDPEYQLDEGLSPRFRGPFLEARGFWTARSDQLEAQVIFARARGALRIDSSDPLDMGQTLRVLSRLEGEVDFQEHRQPIAPQMYVEVPGSSESPRVEYVVQILDEHGNRLFELGNEDAPEAAGQRAVETQVDEERSSDAWLWAVIGVTATIAVASAIATGVVLGIQSGKVGMETTVDLGLTD